MSREPEIEILEIIGVEEDSGNDRDFGVEEPPPEEDLPQKPMRTPVSERVRTRREGINEGVRTVLRELLPALDDLEQCVRQQPDPESLEQGVRLALRCLWNGFRAHDLERIEGEGMAFDPRIHEAAVVTESDRVESGIVLETLRVGYLLAGELVRPAMVRVSGAPGHTR